MATTPRFTPLPVKAIRPYGDGDNPQCFALDLERPVDPATGQPLWTGWKPGQFAMLRPAGWALEMPWARPLSICDVTDDALRFFFQVAGRGTSRMADLRPGDSIHLWGPLGTGFAVKADTPTLLLAGGIGLAPFIGYARAHAQPEQLRLMFAHRPASSCYPLERITAGVHAEDYPENSLADREHFLTAVSEGIKDMAARSGLVLACGPTPFLRYVREQALACGARAQLSLENRMGCGVGACLGCVVTPTAANPAAGPDLLPVRTCVNGPVFWADQVELD